MSTQLDMFCLPVDFESVDDFARSRVRPATTEIQKRDKVMDQLTETRTKLVAAARDIARGMAQDGQRVTSPDVVEQMRAQGYGPEIDRVDLRFMGPVFRRGWREVGSLIGRASPASHSRRVVIWELDL